MLGRVWNTKSDIRSRLVTIKPTLMLNCRNVPICARNSTAGYGTTRIDIPDSGSRKCWSNHAKKNLVITLTAIQAGKKEVITKKVRIKGLSSGNAGISKFRLWRERQQAKRAETTDTSLSTATRTVTETPPSRGRSRYARRSRLSADCWIRKTDRYYTYGIGKRNKEQVLSGPGTV